MAEKSARTRRALRAAARYLPPAAVEAIAARRGALTALERTQFAGWSASTSEDLLVIEPEDASGDPAGIYLFGGCDLPAMFALGPVVGPTAKRTVIVYRPPVRISMCRPDIVLQTLGEIPRELAIETTRRMKLPLRYFRPDLFRPDFDTHVRGVGKVAKTVIMLSAGGSMVRNAYRHKETGLLVDPRWLEDGGRLEREDRDWFSANFESVGRLTVDDFRCHFSELVTEIRNRTGAAVLALNMLTVEPGVRDHNYQLRRRPEGIRRLAFHLALGELATELDFHLVDVDDALKRQGITEQADFAHFPVSAYPAIAGHAGRVLQRAEIL